MNVLTGAFLLAVFERKDFSISEKNPVAIFDRRKVYSQRTGHGERFIPGRDRLLAVFIIVGSFLNEGRRAVPGLAVFLLHGGHAVCGGFGFGCLCLQRD